MIDCFGNLREVTAVTKLRMAEDDIAYLHLLCLALLEQIENYTRKSNISDEEKKHDKCDLPTQGHLSSAKALKGPSMKMLGRNLQFRVD